MRFQDNMKRLNVTHPNDSIPKLHFITFPSLGLPTNDSLEDVQGIAHRPMDLSLHLDMAISEAGGVSVVSNNLRDVSRFRSLLKFRDRDMATLRSERDFAVEDAYQAREALAVHQKNILEPHYLRENFQIEREQFRAMMESLEAMIFELEARGNQAPASFYDRAYQAMLFIVYRIKRIVRQKILGKILGLLRNYAIITPPSGLATLYEHILQGPCEGTYLESLEQVARTALDDEVTKEKVIEVFRPPQD